ncbi:hypothetical protein RFI_19594 [Reticulomyxa filosa]|uniref:Uncharacterized protein n=1 Tax=Reticulomyxa filosa TaxID=46433 RepID=X6MXB1_RETFI|nr:hypothetical protein RFI_19594 [Reticulomyxa filosa]|eukprot:ETO17720.1 hypothetical protein RFI_19594 [Reticulomyxa filosa]
MLCLFLGLLTFVYLNSKGKIETAFYESQSYSFVVMICVDLVYSWYLLYLFHIRFNSVIMEKEPSAMLHISDLLLNSRDTRGSFSPNRRCVVHILTICLVNGLRVIFSFFIFFFFKKNEKIKKIEQNKRNKINNKSMSISTMSISTPTLTNEEAEPSMTALQLSKQQQADPNSKKISLSQIQLDQMQLKLVRNLIRFTNLSVIMFISSFLCELCIIIMSSRDNSVRYSNIYLMGLDASISVIAVHLTMSYSESTYRTFCSHCHWCCQKLFATPFHPSKKHKMETKHAYCMFKQCKQIYCSTFH